MAIGDMLGKFGQAMQDPRMQMLLSSYAQGIGGAQGGIGQGLAQGAGLYQQNLQQAKQQAIQDRLTNFKMQQAQSQLEMQQQQQEVAERTRQQREQMWEQETSEGGGLYGVLERRPDLRMLKGAFTSPNPSDQVGAARILQAAMQEQQPQGPEAYGSFFMQGPGPDAPIQPAQFSRTGGIVPTQLPEGFTAVSPQDPQRRAAIKAAETISEAQAEKKIAHPERVATADYTIELLKGLKTHPGKKYAVGFTGVVPGVPGTEQKGYVALFDQVKGRQYAEAYETLKGGGHITEFEAKTVAQGLSRLDRTLKPGEFDKVVDELIGVIERGKERAEKGITVENPPEDARTGSPAASGDPSIDELLQMYGQ